MDHTFTVRPLTLHSFEGEAATLTKAEQHNLIAAETSTVCAHQLPKIGATP